MGVGICIARLVFGDYSAVTVRIGTRQSSAEFTFLSRLGTTGRTTDGDRLFCAAFFLDHGENTIPISDAGNGQFLTAGIEGFS